MNNLG